jgi:predicted metal-dependent phosphoesterase TrpH
MRPGELVSTAASIGLEAVAITDHDTIKGIPEALQTGRESGISVIAGVEISAEYDPGTMHILGYFKTLPDGLEQKLQAVQAARRKRFPQIIEKLNALGYAITRDDVLSIAGDAQIGRPHIAKALIQKGYVKNYETAFSTYLAKGKPAYVPKEKMNMHQALNLIRHHGGLPVLAHPFTLELESYELKLVVEQLKSAGLKGMEVFYPEHTRAQKKLYTAIARDLDLFMTGGTDYHGLGRGRTGIGDFGVDKETLHIMLDTFNHLQ